VKKWNRQSIETLEKQRQQKNWQKSSAIALRTPSGMGIAWSVVQWGMSLSEGFKSNGVRV
jgi:hypothetical protein